jgi:hypothetical protein
MNVTVFWDTCSLVGRYQLSEDTAAYMFRVEDLCYSVFIGHSL